MNQPLAGWNSAVPARILRVRNQPRESEPPPSTENYIALRHPDSSDIPLPGILAPWLSGFLALWQGVSARLAVSARSLPEPLPRVADGYCMLAATTSARSFTS